MASKFNTSKLNKRLSLLIGLCCLNFSFSAAQRSSALKEIDYSHKSMYRNNNLNDTDSLNLWSYYFKPANGRQNDSIKSLGFVSFQRTSEVADSDYFKIYHKFWSPEIVYEIYNIADLAFCEKESLKTMVLSSCLGSSVGGDYLVVGKFIFINYNVCVNCIDGKTRKDYCRPVIYSVFSKIDGAKANTLDEIFSQFTIKRAKKSPAP